MKSRNKLATYITLIVGVIYLLTGCATQSFQRKKGLSFFHNGEYDHAVEYLQKAVKEKPTAEIKTLLFRAKLNSYYVHLAKARSFKDKGKREEALNEYRITINIFPDNKKLIEEYENYLHPRVKKEEPFKSSVEPPVQLEVNAVEKMSLNLKNTPITKVFKVIGKSYGVNFVFDKDFKDFVYSIEVDNIEFYELLNQLCMVSSAEYRVLDKSSVLIFPNTTFKKRTFGLRGVKVFFLSNIEADEAKKMLMAVFREQQILVQEDKNLNGLIVKAEFNTLVEIDRFLNSIDKRRSEVALDVEILEVTKNVIKALGTNYGDVNSPLTSISAGTVTEGSVESLIRMSEISKTTFYMTLPSAALNFLESNDKNKIISRPNLRGIDGEEIKFMVGDEVPVPQTQFQAMTQGGLNNTPVTTYQYRNVGVEVRVTPTVHKNNEITLKVKLTFNSIAGYQNDFPIFGKRELENIIRLKEGETNIIGGFIKDEFRNGIQGIPALSRLPILGKLFGAAGKEVKETDLIFSITPRIINRMDLKESDLKAIWADVKMESSSATPSTNKAPDQPPDNNRGQSSLIISPAKRRLPVNSFSYFTIRLNSRSKLASLSVSGGISGGSAAIEEAKTEFFGQQKVQVISNYSESNFDFSYSFPKDIKHVNVLAQIKVKFNEKGNYTIDLGNITAMSQDNQPIEIKGTSAEIQVY